MNHQELKSYYVCSNAYNINFECEKRKMSAISMEELQPLCKNCDDEVALSEHFKKFQSRYKYNFNYDLPQNILQKVMKINQKLPNKNQTSEEESKLSTIEAFAFGELKLFTWVIATSCFINKISIQDMKDHHFQQVKKIFHKKSILFIRYEIMCLAYEKTKYAPEWTQEEIDQMTSIIKYLIQDEDKRNLQVNGGRYLINFTVEKWFNHLDPKVRKGKWTIEEDIALLRSVQCLDCKWIEICRELGGVRTEHMIKNRYKSLMKKWKKKYEKTSPKKIVSLVLKHLKNKMKQGDLNSSMSSNEHEEVPVPKKPSKNAKNTEKKEKVEKKEKAEKFEVINEKQVSISQSSKVQTENKVVDIEKIEDDLNQSQFQLGFNHNFSNNWKTTLNLPSEIDNQREINAMIERQEDYFDMCKVGQERKTSDEDCDEIGPTKASHELEGFRLEDQMFEVAGFRNMDILEPESEWLQKMEDKWGEVEDFDDIFGY